MATAALLASAVGANGPWAGARARRFGVFVYFRALSACTLRRLLPGLAALGGLVAVGSSAVAAAQAGDPDVHSSHDRVSISGLKAGGQTQIEYSSGGGSSGPAWECHDILAENPWVEADLGSSVYASVLFSPPDLARKPIRRYLVRCTRGADWFFESGFIYPDQIVDLDAVVNTRARAFYDERLRPNVTVGSSPRGAGLVGVETWFWVDGFDAGARQDSFDVLGRQVVLTLQAQEVRWDFGDGRAATMPAAEGFGQASGPSGVAHRYQVRSTSAAAPDGAMTVRAEVTIGVSYTLDGAGPFVVNPLVSPASRTLVVREAQAVIR